MNKLLTIVLIGATLVFTACGSDDDSTTPVNDCTTCDIDVLGTLTAIEYCDNGNGTMTVTVDGQEDIVDLDGASFDDFIEAVELIATCN
jgi:hypothetical protein